MNRWLLFFLAFVYFQTLQLVVRGHKSHGLHNRSEGHDAYNDTEGYADGNDTEPHHHHHHNGTEGYGEYNHTKPHHHHNGTEGYGEYNHTKHHNHTEGKRFLNDAESHESHGLHNRSEGHDAYNDTEGYADGNDAEPHHHHHHNGTEGYGEYNHTKSHGHNSSSHLGSGMSCLNFTCLPDEFMISGVSLWKVSCDDHLDCKKKCSSFCRKTPTCAGFNGCVAPEVLVPFPRTKRCAGAVCKASECCRI